MEININDVVRVKKMSRCKLCKSDTFVVVRTGTEFCLKCTDCKKDKTLSAIGLKVGVREVVATTFRPMLMDF